MEEQVFSLLQELDLEINAAKTNKDQTDYFDEKQIAYWTGRLDYARSLKRKAFLPISESEKDRAIAFSFIEFVENSPYFWSGEGDFIDSANKSRHSYGEIYSLYLQSLEQSNL